MDNCGSIASSRIQRVEEIDIKSRRRRALPMIKRAGSDDHNDCHLPPAEAGDGNPENVPSSSLGERILQGKSIVEISNVLSNDEIEYLVTSAAQQAEASSTAVAASSLDLGLQGRVCIRMPTVAAANRNDINPENLNSNQKLQDPLSDATSRYAEERILKRILRFVDTRMCPSIQQTLFFPNNNNNNSDDAEDSLSILDLFETDQLQWSTREPAINVYYSPNGHFSMHKDNQALTILVPLTSPEDDPTTLDTDEEKKEDDLKFTGGGTAFWYQSYPIEGMHDPSLVLKPKAGTALLFGGRVSHKGMHVKTGTRIVFVASFSKITPAQHQSIGTGGGTF